MVNGSTLFQQLLLVVQMASAFCLAVGYHTTFNIVVCRVIPTWQPSSSPGVDCSEP